MQEWLKKWQTSNDCSLRESTIFRRQQSINIVIFYSLKAYFAYSEIEFRFVCIALFIKYTAAGQLSRPRQETTRLLKLNFPTN